MLTVIASVLGTLFIVLIVAGEMKLRKDRHKYWVSKRERSKRNTRKNLKVVNGGRR
mgnify:CR=1 FL=1